MAFAGFRARCGSGCGCANGCAIGTGDFSDGVTTGWTTSGTWAETGGLFVGTGAGIATFDTVVPLATDAVMVVTQPRKLSSDGTLRLAIAKVGSEYLFGELAISGGAATLRLGSFSGSATYLTDALVLNDVGTELDARSQLCVSWKPRGEREVAASGTTSTQYPGTVTESGSGWTNKDNAKADDGSVTSFIFPSSAGTEDTTLLQCSNFDMSEVPSDATIDGIQVGVEATGGGGLFTVVDLTAQLFGPNGLTSDNKAVGTVIGSPSTLGYGASNDNWSITGTTADLKDSQFGVQLAFRRTTAFAGGSVTVDYVRMTVYWSTADGRKGTLTASYRNTGDDQAYQCVKKYDVSWDAPDESKSGLVIDSGNWDFSTYSLEFLQTLDRGQCSVCGCSPPEGIEGTSECDTCQPETTPLRLMFTLNGTAVGNDFLNRDCPNINHTQILTLDPAPAENYVNRCNGIPGVISACRWTNCTSGFPGLKAGVYLSHSADDNYYLIIVFEVKSGAVEGEATVESNFCDTPYASLSLIWTVDLGTEEPDCLVDFNLTTDVPCDVVRYGYCSQYDVANARVSLEVIA